MKSQEKVVKLDKTLDKAAKKQIHNYTSQHLIRITMLGEMHLILKSKQQWIVVNSLIMTKQISILDLSKYQGIDKIELNVCCLIDQFY